MDRPDYRSRYLDSLSAEDDTADEARLTDGQATPPALLERLSDPKNGRDDRLDAMSDLQALSFAIERFRPFLGDYLATLRAVATDSDRVVRAQALELLALRRDEYAQRLLLDGLEGRGERLVTERKALKLLGYDQHAAPRELLERLTDSSDLTVRRRALRQLAADGSSAPLFERIARDPDEDGESRRIGLTALQSLDPKSFEHLAHRLIVDEQVDDEIRASCLTALAEGTRAGREPEAAEGLAETARVVQHKTRSRALTRAASDFLDATSSRSDA